MLDAGQALSSCLILHSRSIGGKIIAFPNRQKGVRIENDKLKIATLADIDDPDVREAYRERARADTDNFVFQSPTNGEDLIAAFANFPDGLGQPWQVITVTPIDDFVGTLKATNRLIMVVIIILTMIELFFIYIASSRLSRPVENVSQQLQAIESLQFDVPASRPSNIREIARLEHAAALLRNSLQSFSSFVPLDIVRQLIKSGIPLALGKRVAPSTSSSATASWHSGMPRFSATTMSCVPAPAHCGPRVAWNASTTPGQRKDGRGSVSGSGSIAPMSWSALSARPPGSVTRPWETA